MSSLPRPVALAVLASLAGGLAASGSLALGFGSIGGLLALVQQGLLVGLPLTMALGASTLRFNRTKAAISFALSMAISALSAQLLMMFNLAEPTLLVVVATLYGLVAALVAGAVGSTRRSKKLSDDDVTDDTKRWRDTRELVIPRSDYGSPVPVPPQLRPPEERLEP